MQMKFQTVLYETYIANIKDMHGECLSTFLTQTA